MKMNIHKNVNIEDGQSQSQKIYKSDQVTKSSIESVSLSELMKRQYSDDIWMVDRLIVENGINCIAGKPKSGKSFIVLQISKNIAEGTAVFGKYRTKKSRVLLVTKEDSLRLLKKRLDGFQTKKDLQISFSIDANIYLDDEKYLQRILDKCSELNAKVVIFDSFRRFMRGDENSSEEVTKMHWFFKNLNDNGITVIFNHHFRKGKDVSVDSIRGSSDILAMVDSAIVLDFDKELNVIQVTQCALREDEEEKPFCITFPKFTDEDHEFKIASKHVQEQKTAKDQVLEDVLEYLNEHDELVNQKTIIDALVSPNSSYKTTYVKNALYRLVMAGRIEPIKQGNRIFYQVSGNSSLDQTNIVNDEVTE